MAAKYMVAEILGLTEENMKAQLTLLGDVDEKLKDIYFLKMTPPQWENLSKFVQILNPAERFDHMKVMARFKDFACRCPIASGETPDVVRLSDTIRLKFYANCEVKTDMVFLLTVCLVFSYNPAMALKKCDAITASVLRRKCAQYGIQVNYKKSAKRLTSSSITLTRLSRAFATLTAAIILEHNIEGKIKGELFGGIKKLPLLMQHTMFPELIRESDAELMEIAKFLNIEVLVRLSDPRKQVELKFYSFGELYEKSESYVQSAVSGLKCLAAEKTKALMEGGIIDTNGKLSDVVMAMFGTCERMKALESHRYYEVVEIMRSDPAPVLKNE